MERTKIEEVTNRMVIEIIEGRDDKFLTDVKNLLYKIQGLLFNTAEEFHEKSPIFIPIESPEDLCEIEKEVTEIIEEKLRTEELSYNVTFRFVLVLNLFIGKENIISSNDKIHFSIELLKRIDENKINTEFIQLFALLDG